ncbi:coiled-coil domain-containing protein 27 [Cyrtonyx montezumae]|uniref:coiled-coil domain-containing protein 27 n=1 Tax=Cyrtonyx montezumae TaxID=9017 RepID=UPI0032DB92D0
MALCRRPRPSSRVQRGSEPAGSAPEPRHDELRVPATLRARCPGTCDRGTSPGPPNGAGTDRVPPQCPESERGSGHTGKEGPCERRSDNVPWYIGAINEKEECLVTLVEEIDRLTKYRAKCAQKDVVIANLLKEVECLKEKVDLLKDSAGTEAYTQTEQESSSEEDTEVLKEASALRASPELAEAEKQTLMAQLTAFQKAHRELSAELQKAEAEYNMATGAMCSLQRQLEIQESQLQRSKSENERLQKELRGCENQLQAMSAKFGSLREEWKHEEMMAAMENCRLQQVVTEQESKLGEQMELISSLQGTVWQLQAEALTNQHHIQKQQRAQEEMQSQAGMLQHAELQTRVALECITSKFERFRSKIIQATFSAAGIKAPQAELTDEEVLEALQRIINERTEFHQMLKQKGLKVPSLTSIDTTASSLPGSEGRR